MTRSASWTTSLVPLITRWTELRRRAVTLRAWCLVELGRSVEAVVIAMAAFDEDPLDEGVARVAMVSLHRAGRQAEALRLGQRHRVALAEAGLEVGPAIASTERELLHESATTPTIGRVPPPFYGNRCIGRDRDLVVAEQAIAERRLTTLIGPGGVGKTRLARELAVGSTEWWCDLSVVTQDTDLTAVVCSQLRVRPDQGAAVDDALRDALRHESGLLVLDNCDGLTVAAARLASGLLSWCPDVNVLATCRPLLGVAGEHLLEVPPLPVGLTRRPPTCWSTARVRSASSLTPTAPPWPASSPALTSCRWRSSSRRDARRTRPRGAHRPPRRHDRALVDIGAGATAASPVPGIGRRWLVVRAR